MPFLSPRKIIIVGATGSGKSSLGNTLLRKNAFATGNGYSATTYNNKLDETQCRFVVDTPGFYDANSQVNIAQNALQVAEALDILSKPHAFLFVVRFDRLEKEALHVTNLLQITFGKRAVEYSIVVVTCVPSEISDATFQMKLKENEKTWKVLEMFSERTVRIDNMNPDIEHVSKIMKLVNVVSRRGTNPFENENFDCLKKILMHEAKHSVFHLCSIDVQFESIYRQILAAEENENIEEEKSETSDTEDGITNVKAKRTRNEEWRIKAKY